MASDPNKRDLQTVIEALLIRRLEESLALVETAIARWRRGEIDALVTHGEVLRLAARAGALSARVARSSVDGPNTLLRDAFDAGVVSRDEFVSFTGRPPEDVPPPPSLDEELTNETAAGSRDKRAALGKLLDDGAVLVHLDARRDGVKVPSAHQEDPRLVLRLGYRLSPPIPDLSVEEDGVCATLSFRGVPFGCVLPWRSVYAIVSEDGRGLVWPEDVPPEAAREFAKATEKSSEKSEDREDSPPRPTPPRRGHLRLV